MKKSEIIFSLFLILSLNFILTSCQSTSALKLKEMNYSLKEIRKAIVDISGEPRTESENKRVIGSQYFGRSVPLYKEMLKNKERFYALFYILGSEAPYDILVEVHSERRRGNRFEENDIDATLSETIANELKARLTQSRDTRNLIDDFRPF